MTENNFQDEPEKIAWSKRTDECKHEWVGFVPAIWCEKCNEIRIGLNEKELMQWKKNFEEIKEEEND